MKELGNKKLVLFMTQGGSLKKWDEAGILEREIVIYKKLAKRFKRIDIITYGGREDECFKKNWPGNVYVRVKPKWIPNWLYGILVVLWQGAVLKEADVLKTNQIKGALPAGWAKVLYGKKLVVRCGFEWLLLAEDLKYAKWKKIFIYWYERWVYRMADKIIMTSKKDGLFVVRRFKEMGDKIKVIANYVDEDLFREKRRDGFKGRVVAVGRLAKEKNFDLLIRAIKGTGLKLMIVGKGEDENYLRELAQEMEVEVEWKGRRRQDEMVEILRESDVLVMPSKREGNPKALIEAMMVGLLVVGNNVPGINDVIMNNETGILFDGTEADLRDKFRKIINGEIDLDKIGNRARKQAIANFSLRVITNKEKDVYESL